MKIRSGFVSNSSSSSFIIGVGLLKEEDLSKFKEKLEKYKIDEESYELYTISELLKEEDTDYLKVNRDEAFIESFTYDRASITFDKNRPNDLIIGMYFSVEAETDDDGNIIEGDIELDENDDKLYDLASEMCVKFDSISGTGFNG